MTKKKSETAEPKIKRPRAKKPGPITKAGDGYPLDLLGNFIAEGSTVVIAQPVSTPGYVTPFYPDLKLGYVSKLGKSFAEVVIFHSLDEQEIVRFLCVRSQLLTVNPDCLDSRNPLYEKIKMEAAVNKSY